MSLVYLLFSLSGAAALAYQVVWVRSLTLVFGGSHLAVTVVLTTFMAGLAIGSCAFGPAADRVRAPLRLYGLLELGIAASALASAALIRVYPSTYAALAQGKDDSTVYLAAVRTVFSAVALVGPTTLMGGTLPVLSRFACRERQAVRTSLSLLYGLNTLGAVAGALVASFVLLRLYPVSVTLYLAVATNALVGVAGLALSSRLSDLTSPGAPTAAADVSDRSEHLPGASSGRLVLWSIGISGFCALGYEVLWTRVLALAVGASVYGFTIMLVAFLAGIALGSTAYGLAAPLGATRRTPARALAWFGAVQVGIGITALIVTVCLRDIPTNAARLQGVFQGLFLQSGAFPVRVWASFSLAWLYMVVPACLMGVAVPLAGEIHARHRRAIGRAVGEVLAYNTAGAIMGAALSGFALIYWFGIERSLQILCALNVAAGVLVLTSLASSRRLQAAVATGAVAAVAVLAASPRGLSLWNTRYFAIYRSNQPEAFATPELVREALENTDVLYYAEGVESIVSVIRVKGGEQSFLTNGRVEASSHLQAQQLQLALGHLPMLLAPDPRHVLVVGMGTGMTAGAVSVHPGVARVTVAEIEPNVIGVARRFAPYNHGVLDSSKLRVVFNDGRNFLMTTPERFDVITADPIHPWFRGAGYLYTAQYFELAAKRLTPGGVMAQWLPIYELAPQDLRSIVRTFREHFAHTLLFLTHYDAELLGSNAPLLLDEAELTRRMAPAAVAEDLTRVTMGSSTDLLSYFVMGADGMARFSHGAVLNSDELLHLEFSAPFSIAAQSVMEANVRALSAHRESILAYLAPAGDPRAREEQRRRWDRQREAAAIGDVALALFLGGRTTEPRFTRAMAELDRDHSWYAPGRFLQQEHRAALALAPRRLDAESFAVVNAAGQHAIVEISAVLVPVSRTRAAIMFVDNRARVVYGQRYVDTPEGSDAALLLAADVMTAIRTAYRTEAGISHGRGHASPPEATMLRKLRGEIAARLRRAGPDS